MRWIYQISIYLYAIIIRIASVGNRKAQKWIGGRKNWRTKLAQAVGDDNWIWFHCASLGEFEQGRPLMESLRKKYPHVKLCITFFSPSGYEIKKNYTGADLVLYLPLDTPRNASHFVNVLTPSLVIFVKYELWINILFSLFEKNIPTLLISVRLQPNSAFFTSPFSKLYRKAFSNFTCVFTQDQATADLLKDFAPEVHVRVSSDTRYDRVFHNYEHFTPITQLPQFIRDRKCIICGSTWPQDETLIFEAFEKIDLQHQIALIIAPHEINLHHIQKWMQSYPKRAISFSQIENLNAHHNILWIDNIGMLSRIYGHGHIAYVGGAWKQGLHNILEPAVFGLPVIFGPKYEKYPEANELIELGTGYTISNSTQLYEVWNNFIGSSELLDQISRKSKHHIFTRTGATKVITDYCISLGLFA